VPSRPPWRSKAEVGIRINSAIQALSEPKNAQIQTIDSCGLNSNSSCGTCQEITPVAYFATFSSQPFRYPLTTYNPAGYEFGYYVKNGGFAGKYDTAQDCGGTGALPCMRRQMELSGTPGRWIDPIDFIEQNK
jgi:hypothetical protein